MKCLSTYHSIFSFEEIPYWDTSFIHRSWATPPSWNFVYKKILYLPIKKVYIFQKKSKFVHSMFIITCACNKIILHKFFNIHHMFNFFFSFSLTRCKYNSSKSLVNTNKLPIVNVIKNVGDPNCLIIANTFYVTNPNKLEMF